MTDIPLTQAPADRTRPKVEGELAELRRAQIIEAAMAVIARRGVAETRLVDVADQAGVSVGMLQHYFRSRENLVRETFLAAHADSLAKLRSLAAAEPDPFRRLVGFVEWVVTGRWSLWVEIWAASSRDEVLRGAIAKIYKEWALPFREAIGEGVALGLFNPRGTPEDVADRIVSEIDGLGVRMLLGDPRTRPRRMVGLLVDQLRLELGIGADAEGAVRRR